MKEIKTYYSDNGKSYSSKEECLKADEEFKNTKLLQEKQKKQRAEEAKAVENAYKDWVKTAEQNKKVESEKRTAYLKLRNEFINKYGYFHMTYSDTSDISAYLSTINSIKDFFNDIF